MKNEMRSTTMKNPLYDTTIHYVYWSVMQCKPLIGNCTGKIKSLSFKESTVLACIADF